MLQRSHEECINALQVAALKAQSEIDFAKMNKPGQAGDDPPSSKGASSSKDGQHKPNEQSADKTNDDAEPKKTELRWDYQAGMGVEWIVSYLVGNFDAAVSKEPERYRNHIDVITKRYIELQCHEEAVRNAMYDILTRKDDPIRIDQVIESKPVQNMNHEQVAMLMETALARGTR